MGNNRLNGLLRLLSPLLFLFILVPATGLAANHGHQEATWDDVKEQAEETYDVIKQYTLDQRDQAIAAAEKKLNKFDHQIKEMEKNIQARWQNMSETTRDNAQKTLDALRAKRNEVAEWYGGMRHSSEAAWEDVKKGFSDSYDRLQKAFEKAKKDFEPSEDSPTTS